MKKDTLIAIIRGVNSDDIVDITKCLLDSGISWMEVSLSDEEKGLECIKKVSESFGNQIHLGVGTITTTRQVDASIVAGANYIITPGWDQEIVKYVLSKEIPIFPGVFSPGEIGQASRLGIGTVKLFPVVNLGIDYIKNIRGPFPDMKLMAVGGVNKKNIKELKQVGCSYFAIGSDLVPRGATKTDLEKIKENALVFNQLLSEEF
ncbi:aldolase [Virgibacillus dakarensis]|nr:aldolase [Virgibacillus dakarensis]